MFKIETLWKIEVRRYAELMMWALFGPPPRGDSTNAQNASGVKYLKIFRFLNTTSAVYRIIIGLFAMGYVAYQKGYAAITWKAIIGVASSQTSLFIIPTLVACALVVTIVVGAFEEPIDRASDNKIFQFIARETGFKRRELWSNWSLSTIFIVAMNVAMIFTSWVSFAALMQWAVAPGLFTLQAFTISEFTLSGVLPPIFAAMMIVILAAAAWINFWALTEYDLTIYNGFKQRYQAGLAWGDLKPKNSFNALYSIIYFIYHALSRTIATLFLLSTTLGLIYPAFSWAAIDLTKHSVLSALSASPYFSALILGAALVGITWSVFRTRCWLIEHKVCKDITLTEQLPKKANRYLKDFYDIDRLECKKSDFLLDWPAKQLNVMKRVGYIQIILLAPLLGYVCAPTAPLTCVVVVVVCCMVNMFVAVRRRPQANASMVEEGLSESSTQQSGERIGQYPGQAWRPYLTGNKILPVRVIPEKVSEGHSMRHQLRQMSGILPVHVSEQPATSAGSEVHPMCQTRPRRGFLSVEVSEGPPKQEEGGIDYHAI